MFAASSPVTLCTPGSVYDLAHQLAAGRVNVITPGGAHCHHKASVHQHLPKPTDRIAAGSLITRIGKIVKRDEVDLAGIVLQQRGEFSRLLDAVVDPREQGVLNSDYPFFVGLRVQISPGGCLVFT